jgi:predicted DNA-binding protein (UPF0251 family)
VETKLTVRQAAKKLGISKSTVHRALSESFCNSEKFCW